MSGFFEICSRNIALFLFLSLSGFRDGLWEAGRCSSRVRSLHQLFPLIDVHIDGYFAACVGGDLRGGQLDDQQDCSGLRAQRS